MQQLIFDSSEVESLKDIQSEKEIVTDDELEELIKLKKNITQKPIDLAILFIKCYDILAININEFGDNKEKLSNYLNTFSLEQLRSFVENYGGGKEYGDALTESNIRSRVGKYREKYLDLIKLFFQIFEEE